MRRLVTSILRPRGEERSLRLLHVFLLASALILAGGAVVLGSVLADTVQGQAIHDAQQSLTQYVDGVLRPDLVRGNRIVVGPAVTARIRRQLAGQPDLVTVKVWRADGVLAWTNRDRGRIGRRFEVEDRLGDALHDNRTVGGLDALDANGERV